MSQETANWLNTNTLIGYTNQRGRAWHYRAEEQGSESNHYPGPIPVEDVMRRLFYWKAIEGDFKTTIITPTGVDTITDPERKAIVRPDTRTVLGIFKKGYKIHQFDEWLIQVTEGILDDNLQIGSAGLLKGGAVAWVSIEVPETIVTPEGVSFRPHLLAAGAHDGSLSSTYQGVATNTVCDNTMSAALSEGGPRLKVKHSRHSIGKLQDAREAIGIVHTIGADFAQQVADLTAVKVSDNNWEKVLDALLGKPSTDATKRSQTMYTNKREGITNLYDNDMRVAPWRGTAYGVVQAVNTFTHHGGIVRGAERGERNMLRAVTGGVDKLDRTTVQTVLSIVG